MKIVIPGDPIAKMRARYSQHGGFVRTYDPQQKEKEHLKSFVLREIQKNGFNFDQNALFCIEMRFHLPALKCWNQCKRNANLWGTEKEAHKPDLDNLEKMYNDILNEIVYKDDCQIIKLSSEKFYSLQPRTEIEIMEIPKWDLPKETLKFYQNISPDELQELVRDMRCFLLNYDFFDTTDHLDKVQHFVSTANDLKKFSLNHTKKLSKIAKISQDTDSH